LTAGTIARLAVDVSKNEIWIPATLDGAVVIALLKP